jgi:solute carrier family 35 protein E1
MTVLAYRIFFDFKYSIPTYLSLVPLTVGVVMACSASYQANFFGLIYAFGSAILFVVQNIVSKAIFNEAAKAEEDGLPFRRRKPDKLNLLCYSSGLALAFTFPIWLWFEGLDLMADYLHDGSIDLRDRPGALDHGRLSLEFIFNGTFHFGQSLVAFVLLGMVSPVTYSVASLIKRVAVIMFAIVWFGSPMTRVQGFGFILTFLGLYLYDRTSDAAKSDRRAREKAEAGTPLLPLSTADVWKRQPAVSQSPLREADIVTPLSGGTSRFSNGEPLGRPVSRPLSRTGVLNGVPIALPLGTKAESTWLPGSSGRAEAVR